MITLNELKEYRDHPAWSQSKLKGILGEKERKETPGMQKGSLIDVLFTSATWFNELYHIGTSKVNPTIKECVDELFTPEFNLVEIKDSFIALIREKGYQSKWKDETIWAKTLDEWGGKEYWNLKASLGDKTLITEDEYHTATVACETLKEFIMKSGLIYDSLFMQQPLYGEICGFQCKGLPDVLSIDERNKIIYEIDLKVTEESREGFFQIAKKFRYDVQKAFYRELIRQNFPEYVIGGYWLVYPRSCKPFLVKVKDIDYYIGMFGADRTKTFIEGYDSSNLSFSVDEKSRIVGIVDLFQKVKLKEEYGLENYDIEYHENNGIFNKSIYE